MFTRVLDQRINELRLGLIEVDPYRVVSNECWIGVHGSEERPRGPGNKPSGKSISQKRGGGALTDGWGERIHAAFLDLRAALTLRSLRAEYRRPMVLVSKFPVSLLAIRRMVRVETSVSEARTARSFIDRFFSSVRT